MSTGSKTSSPTRSTSCVELLPLEAPGVVDEPDAVDEPEVPDVLEEGVVGWKKVLPAPKPIFAALVPPTEIVAVSFSPLTTSWPVLFSHAATCALP